MAPQNTLPPYNRGMARPGSPPQRQTLRFCKAFFEVSDRLETRQRLLSAGALELVGPAGTQSEAADLWYRWDEPSEATSPPAISFLIRITGHRLVLEGPTGAAVGRGWRALDAQLRPHARARVAAGDDLGRFLPRQRRHSADRPESWSREHQDRVLQEFYAAFCQRWARQPHPQLDGKTPLEAASDPTLSSRLDALLSRMEKVEERRRERHMASISVEELKRTLGKGAS